MKRARRLSFAMLLAVALVSSSCGGGDDNEAAPSTTASDAASSELDRRHPDDHGGKGRSEVVSGRRRSTPPKAPSRSRSGIRCRRPTKTRSRSSPRSTTSAQTKVKVALKYQGTYDESIQKYVAGVRGGELPSMIQTEETAMQTMIDSKSIVPIGACVAAENYDLSDFTPGLIGQYSFAERVADDAVPAVESDPLLQQEGVPRRGTRSGEAPDHAHRDPRGIAQDRRNGQGEGRRRQGFRARNPSLVSRAVHVEGR